MIITHPQLAEVRRRHRHAKIVLGAGTFDILHKGHLEYLEDAKQRGDILVVIVPSDESVAYAKGPGRPVLDEQTRITLVDALKPVDYTHLVYRYRPIIRDIADALRPDVILLPDDVPQTVEAELRDAFPRITIERRTRPPGVSVTRIIESIIEKHKV